METWHVSTENGWKSVEAEEQPEGNMVHLAEAKCLDWECGWVGYSSID